MNSSDLTVTVLPFEIAWSDRDYNLRKVEEMLGKIPDGTDIFVLPELFSTGFISDHETVAEMAETTSETTIETVRSWARQRNAAFAGSFLCRVGSRFYNRAFFIEPGGDEVYYDKRHLFSISPENKLLQAGRERCPVIRFRGWNVSLAVCYDIRFPVWCRNVGMLYEVMLVPANWPEARAYAWKHLLIGRSIENEAYYVGANRGGSDDYGRYDNLSFIFDPAGRPVGTSVGETCAITATLDRKLLEEMRRKLPVGADAENFDICDL